MDSASERREIARRWARSARMWKMIASASAGAALTIALVTSLRGDHATPGHPAVRGTNTSVGNPDTPTGADQATSATSKSASTGTGPAEISTTRTSSASFDAADAGEEAATERQSRSAPVVTVPPAAPTTLPTETSSDAATPADAGNTSGDDRATREANAPEARDAGAALSVDPWAPPSMSAGAGPFSTQAPYWGASAFVSDPNAGAGRFTTEAPPWAASAFTSDRNAGAGAFTTEWNIPGYGAVWAPPYLGFGPIAPR
jgi:hypothetical protein